MSSDPALIALLSLAGGSLATAVAALVHSAFSFGKIIASQEALKTDLTQCQGYSSARNAAVDQRILRLENMVLTRPDS